MATSVKTAILVMSDPAVAGDEPLGRVFNALATAYDLDQAGHAVRLHFHGAGTRWPQVLNSPSHPAYDLYQAVRHTVAGASRGCADVFGATEGVKASGLNLIEDNAVPGTPGLASLRVLIEDGYSILSF
ncbi:MAG TPA: DsrE family protein [Acidimicrobiales bacterium]|nr:DsrE family protein [Acidimicrobiales bacterium]